MKKDERIVYKNNIVLLLKVQRKYKKGSGHNAALIISNDEMKDILEILRSLEDSGLLLKGISESIKNEAKEQKGGFLSMLLGTLGASLLRNMLAGKGVIRAGEEAGIFNQKIFI